MLGTLYLKEKYKNNLSLVKQTQKSYTKVTHRSENQLMQNIIQNKKSLSSSITIAIFGLLFCYFLYHSVSGDRGLMAMVSLTQTLEKSKYKLDLIRAERLQQEHRVSLLKPESLDLDLLEEQARRYIGYSDKNEVVISLKD